MSSVMVFGTFDHLHPGHRFVLDAAGKRGDVMVIVATDPHVGQIKGRVPDQSQTERIAAVQAAYPSFMVSVGDATDFLAPLRKYKPDLILLGYDQRLPPGVQESDLPCPTERLSAFEPEKYKSSLRRLWILS